MEVIKRVWVYTKLLKKTEKDSSAAVAYLNPAKHRKNLNDLKSKLVDLSQRLNDPIDYDNPMDSWEKIKNKKLAEKAMILKN